MTTIRDKLEIFHKLIYEQEEEKYKDVLKELDEKRKDLVERKKLEVEKRNKDAIRRKALLEETEKNKVISGKVQEMKSKFLSKRNEILEDLLVSLKERANSFTFTDEYIDTIVKQISKAIENADEEELMITITEDDREKLENSILEIGQRYGKNISICTVAKSKLIGGFMLSDKDRTYNMDNSYKTTIDENRYEIGKRLYEALEEAGDFQWKI